MSRHSRRTRNGATITDRSQARTFAEILPGETFYRHAGHYVHTMVKANETCAVMVEDAPASMKGESTPYWEVPAMELMIPETRVEEIRKSEPEVIKTSSLDL